MSRWAGLFGVALFWTLPVWAGEAAVPVPNWDPNGDAAYTADYIRRELTLELERVDPRRGISGSIRNDGSMTLTRVRVLLTFMDAAGRPGGEFEFSALPWAGPVGAGEPTERPLTPGSTRKFLVYPSSVAAGWSDRWQAAITSITFAPE